MNTNSNGTQIVYVEDNPNDVAVALRAFRRHLPHRKVKVLEGGIEAVDYIEAVEQGEREAPRVVFLDLKMPQVDGLQVLQKMRSSEHLRHVPVVMISSSKDEQDIENSYRLGVNSYVVKRFQPDRPGEYLVDIARYWLELNEGP